MNEIPYLGFTGAKHPSLDVLLEEKQGKKNGSRSSFRSGAARRAIRGGATVEECVAIVAKSKAEGSTSNSTPVINKAAVLTTMTAAFKVMMESRAKDSEFEQNRKSWILRLNALGN